MKKPADRGGSRLDSREVGDKVSGTHDTLEQSKDEVRPNLQAPEMQHKSLVEPIFLAYNRVSLGSGHTPLMDIATAAVQALNNPQAMDVVQLMHTG